MYPNSPNLIIKFEEKSEKIMDLLDEKIKDSSSRQLLENLKNAKDISQSKNYLIFF